MEKLREEIINKAIDKLEKLTKEDFHGYRSEVWGVVAEAMDNQLSTPSGLIAKKECKAWSNPDCLPECNGDCDKDGYITRELTIGEVLGWSTALIKYIDPKGPLQLLTVLSSGERIELKK